MAANNYLFCRAAGPDQAAGHLYGQRCSKANGPSSSPVSSRRENLLYAICGVNKDEEMGWKRYAWSVVLFNLALLVSLFAILMTQHLLAS